jgi:poly [ADP-ribose] polymerase
VSEIVREAMLVKVSATDNNNKFYHVTLDSNGQLVKRWGRVGTEGQTTLEKGDDASFDRIIKAKTRASHGYKETGIVSSNSKKSSASVNSSELESVAKSVLTTRRGDPDLDRLIEILVKSNAHQILESSGGLIKVNDEGVISTPLGILNRDTIRGAEKVLSTIKNPKSVASSTVEEYLHLVPQAVPRARGWAADFFSEHTSVSKQKEFLEQLSESLKWYESEAKAQNEASSDGEVDLSVKYAKLFRSKIDILDPKSKEWNRINKYYMSSMKRHHTSSRLRLKRVYVLSDEEGQEKYEAVRAKLGNERQLWHGTRAVNVLSILRSGLYVPASRGGSIQVTGRMFGDGVYFSDTSTKSLNYAAGYWSGTKEQNTFMFLADVTMGEEYKPTRFSQQSIRETREGVSKNGKPYNSIHIAPGTCNVINNEIVVWNTEQINLRYLCEFG